MKLWEKGTPKEFFATGIDKLPERLGPVHSIIQEGSALNILIVIQIDIWLYTSF